jgi:RimJ/RimL family protein N-acetyltransferase
VNLFAHLPHIRERVCLRRLRMSDFPAFHAYRSDPEVARYQGWSPMDEAGAQAYLHEQDARIDADSAGRWVQLAIAETATDTLLGDMGIWQLHDGTEAELGITVTPASQGRGIGRSALRAALDVLFADPAMARVRASTDARNLPCRRMLIAAGFREIDTARVFVKEEACIEHRYLAERARIVHAPAGETP